LSSSPAHPATVGAGAPAVARAPGTLQVPVRTPGSVRTPVPDDTAGPDAAPGLLSGEEPVSRPGERSVAELLAALKALYGERDRASDAYRRAAGALRDQQQRTDKLERRLVRTRHRLSEERRTAARIARAQYRAGAPGLPTAVQVLLADDPVVALHHGHVLERASARQQATVRALASGERHRGAAAARAHEALQRQQRLADRKERKRQGARRAMHEVERMLTSLTPAELTALHRYEEGGGSARPPVAS
ncbi:hypothetical protein N566_06080, partial [Streptomycetaceae bacterium MP113-05]